MVLIKIEYVVLYAEFQLNIQALDWYMLCYLTLSGKRSFLWRLLGLEKNGLSMRG